MIDDSVNVTRALRGDDYAHSTRRLGIYLHRASPLFEATEFKGVTGAVAGRFHPLGRDSRSSLVYNLIVVGREQLPR